jgi:CHAT domain-containing protein/Tfp pilus assembly protein PilF
VASEIKSILLIALFQGLLFCQLLRAQGEIDTLLFQCENFIDFYRFDSANQITARLLTVIEKESVHLKPELLSDIYLLHGRSLVGLLKKDEASYYLNKSLQIRKVNRNPDALFYAKYCIAQAQNWSFFNIDSSRAYIDLAFPFARDLSEQEPQLLARVYWMLANNYRRMGKLDSLYQVTGKGIRILEMKPERDYDVIGHLYRSLGYWYDETGDLKKAIETYEKAWSVARQKFAEDHLFHSFVMIDLANIYLYQDRFAEAEKILLQSLPIKIKYHGKYHPGTSFNYQTLGIVENKLQKYQEAIRYNKFAIEINDSLYGPGNRWSANVYNNLGSDYMATGRFELARISFGKSYDGNLRAGGPGSFNLIYPLGNLGDLAVMVKDFAGAKTKYQEALDICQIHYGPFYRFTIEMQIKLANILVEEGKYLEATELINMARTGTHYPVGKTESFDNVNYPFLLLQVFLASSKLLESKYQKWGEKGHLLGALQEIIDADSLVNFVRNRFSEDDSKFIFSQSTFPVFEQGIRLAYLLGQLDHQGNYKDIAWRFSEKSKSLALLEAVYRAKARSFYGIPDEKVQKAIQLQESIVALSREWSELEDQESAPGLKIRSYLSEMMQENQQLMDYFEKYHPDYFGLKYHMTPLSIVDAEVLASELECNFLEYFIGEHQSYVWLIQKDTSFWIQLDTSNLLEDLLIFSRNIRTSPSLGLKNADDFFASSKKLYKALIAPIAEKLSGRLIIIPSENLYLIPFEALAIDTTDPSERPGFFVEEHAISYAFSTAFLRESRTRSSQRLKDIYYFAPSFTDSDLPSHERKNGQRLSSLLYNVREIQSLAKIFPGQVYTGSSAKVSSFRKATAQARIIHLATHAIADTEDGEKSRIYFSGGNIQDNGIFYAKDLYALKIPAEMVVLSACQTGSGQLRKGEGIIGLSRGFFYAGAQSIISSLWNVNDQSSNILMTHFYRNLKNGLPKDEALKNAKVEYLQQISEPQQAHPYFWATFVALGKMDSLSEPEKPLYATLFFALIIVAVVFFYLSKN